MLELTVEINEHVCFIAIFPPKLNIDISTLYECHDICNNLGHHLQLDFEVITTAIFLLVPFFP